MKTEAGGLSIIILNHNTYELTCDCIHSILSSSIDKSNLEIILVDNGSTQYQPQQFKDVFPQIIYLKSQINLGFAKGNNLGIDRATKPYLLLLNSDTLITDPETFSKCIEKVRQFNDEIVLTTKLLTEAGEPQVAYGFLPSITYELMFTSFFYKLLSIKKREELLIKFTPNENRLIEKGYIVATFYLFPKKVLSKLADNKLYDDLFLYGEELFWCTQCLQVGCKMFYFADVSIIHLIGRSSKKNVSRNSARRTFQLQGEHKYLLWRYSKIAVSLIYFLRIIRFGILSLFDADIRLRFKILLKLLLKINSNSKP